VQLVEARACAPATRAFGSDNRDEGDDDDEEEEADDGKSKSNDCDEDSECVRRCMLGNKLAASVDVHARL
jgi:hypothetical protein